MGGPKALLPAPGGGTLVEAAVRLLLDGGCDGVTVVVGADGDAVAETVRALPGTPDVEVASCPDWAEGMGASLRAGLSAIRDGDGAERVEAVLVTLVDLPDLTPAVARRLFAHPASWRAALRRAAYQGRPGHPALIGRDLWDETIATAVGDRGAREVFRTHPHDLIECGDLATGRDVDTREEARKWGLPSAKPMRE